MKMSWKAPFNRGTDNFHVSKLDEALENFNEACQKDGARQYMVYDCRAAVYERLGRPKDALRDARKVIEIAPDRWQGYSRSARLLLQARRFDASLTMISMSLERLKPADAKRRHELLKLKRDVLAAIQTDHPIPIKHRPYYFGELPVEIVAEIFRALVAEDSANLILLLHICKHWRDVAWNTPSLWDKLVLTGRHPARKTTLWLKQSRGRIRELCVRVSVFRDPDWPFPQLSQLQWTHLRVCRIEGWDISKYLETIGMWHTLAFFEELEVIDIRRDLAPTKRDALFVPDARMRKLTLDTASFSWHSLPARLQNLTHLHVQDCGINHESILATLEANSRLQTFIYDINTREVWTSPRRAEPLILLHLTHLELAGPLASDILEEISTPSLQILRIVRATKSLDRAFGIPADRGSSQLTSLCISLCSITPASVISFMQETPTLQSLEVSRLANVANEVVEALASPPENGPLCPDLTNLNISHSPDMQTGPLVRLVRTRKASHEVTANQGVRPIQALNADGCTQLDPKWIPWFRENVFSVSCIYMSRKEASWRR